MRRLTTARSLSSARKTSWTRPRGSLRRQTLRSTGFESLEQRSLLAVLVSDALSGTADTTIGGTIYNDLDGNGIRNNGEDGVQGWTVYLDLDNSGTLNTDAVGDTEPSAVSNVDGDYVIRFLKPSTYRVAEVVQEGWRPTGPVSRDVKVNQSQDAVADFFNFAGATIEGTVWNDLNADSIRDVDPDSGEFTDPGLPGWTIFLDLNKNQNPDVGEPTALTDETGFYAFTDVPAGDYRVVEVIPDGWEVSPEFDNRQDVELFPLDTAVADFANFSTTSGSLRGTIWNDANIDGIRNTDPDTGEFTEPGLADWTVYLDVNFNFEQDPGEPTAVTNASGVYAFVSLPVGDYDVAEVLPEGWNLSPEFDGRFTVTVDAGAETIAPDFANFNVTNGSLRGTIWNDVNRNGLRDADLSGAFTEPGLVNWTVFLDLNRNGSLDELEPTALTDADGVYTIADLQVGEYKIREILPAGWEPAPTFGDSESVTVFSGVETIAPDFANFQIVETLPANIEGTVWEDVDGDGVRDFDPESATFTDPGLAGWTLFADLNHNGVADGGEPQNVSAADGSYALAGLTPGTVTIVQQIPAGWRPTAPPSTSQTVSLRNGDAVSNLDFGNERIKDSVIRGTVFADANRDGVRGVDEQGLGGLTVYLDLNNDSILDPAEPQHSTSADQFYTPAVDEAGAYAFTHLAPGTYTVRVIVPAKLSATPAAQLEHVVTVAAGEERSGVDTAAVFRPNEIHGVRFHDANRNHQRDAGEAGLPGATVYVDYDRDNVMDDDEPRVVTGDDGSYSFGDLSPGAYVVREFESPGYEQTYPTTVDGILWPDGVSNPAMGNVDPSSITMSLAEGESHPQTVSITLPQSGALTNMVDVFLLFDDTGSFVNNSPIVRSAFPDIIAALQASLPGIDLGFGVGRFEEYANYASEYAEGRPFVLNQPIVAATNPDYMASIQAALNRTAPGYGGDGPETDIEALYQLVTGLGFDGNNNGSVFDSGPAGMAHTQLNPGASGDVPSFASFQADTANGVLAPSGNVGGAGFRAGALPIILTATDIGFAYQPFGEAIITGVGGATLPIGALTGTSRPDTPFGAGAGIQETITALNALGALVIGLGTNAEANFDPRQGLEALSTLTGAVNHSTATIDNGTIDPIAPGDPLYFQIASGFGASVASGITNAIQNAVTNVAVNIDVQASDPRVKILNHTGVLNNLASGATATFDIEFVGDGIPHRFDLQFVRAGTNVVLGSIPVVIGTPIPGDGYEFEDLEEGEIEDHSDFGSASVATLLGDTNHDGHVNIVDLNNVRNDFGASGPGVTGDTNGDLVVNIVDLNNVRNNFGASLDGAPAAAPVTLVASSNVPTSPSRIAPKVMTSVTSLAKDSVTVHGEALQQVLAQGVSDRFETVLDQIVKAWPNVKLKRGGRR
ncbi:MAG: SdrD B-like domain-containing protein [Planctomycetia bacterium]|nr:SdrD B-like domain-containing protein [Planctomycetia bacterium]